MSLGHSTSYLEFSSKCCHSQETDEKRRGSSVISQLLFQMILDVEKKTYLGGCRLFFQPGMMMMMLLSWFFCHSSGRMSFFFLLFRGFITRITTTSWLSSYLVLLCWRNLQEHSWASISVEGRLHSWGSLSPRLGCEKHWHPNWF